MLVDAWSYFTMGLHIVALYLTWSHFLLGFEVVTFHRSLIIPAQTILSYWSYHAFRIPIFVIDHNWPYSSIFIFAHSVCQILLPDFIILKRTVLCSWILSYTRSNLILFDHMLSMFRCVLACLITFVLMCSYCHIGLYTIMFDHAWSYLIIVCHTSSCIIIYAS